VKIVTALPLCIASFAAACSCSPDHEVIEKKAQIFADACGLVSYKLDLVDEEVSGAPNFLIISGGNTDQRIKAECAVGQLRIAYHDTFEEYWEVKVENLEAKQ
jgi:hypothetical protein